MSFRTPLLYDPLKVNDRLKWTLIIAGILMAINVLAVVHLTRDGPAYLSASNQKDCVWPLVVR
jgi:cell division protein FtsL